MSFTPINCVYDLFFGFLVSTLALCDLYLYRVWFNTFATSNVCREEKQYHVVKFRIAIRREKHHNNLRRKYFQFHFLLNLSLCSLPISVSLNGKKSFLNLCRNQMIKRWLIDIGFFKTKLLTSKQAETSATQSRKRDNNYTFIPYFKHFFGVDR